jgi:hypothetical protein
MAEHRRSFGRGETVYDPWHYVNVGRGSVAPPTLRPLPLTRAKGVAFATRRFSVTTPGQGRCLAASRSRLERSGGTTL